MVLQHEFNNSVAGAVCHNTGGDRQEFTLFRWLGLKRGAREEQPKQDEGFCCEADHKGLVVGSSVKRQAASFPFCEFENLASAFIEDKRLALKGNGSRVGAPPPNHENPVGDYTVSARGTHCW